MLSVFDALFDVSRLQDLNAPAGRAPTVAVPPLDVRESADAFELWLDLPGVKPADLTISVDGDQLRIGAELKRPELPEGVRLQHVERHAGRFLRTLRIPRAVDPTQIEAKLSEGVLTITLAKRSEVKPRTIEVKAA
jgi:HSP20 family protein